MKYLDKSKLVPKYEHGIPMGKYQPFEAVGTVIHIKRETTICTYYDDDGKPAETKYYGRTWITFEYEIPTGGKTYFTTVFNNGEVFPEKLGEKALGIVITSQWGSYEFVLTHLLK
jgi:hypothetical protein